jgi:hypothetical protein
MITLSGCVNRFQTLNKSYSFPLSLPKVQLKTKNALPWELPGGYRQKNREKKEPLKVSLLSV